MAQILPPPTTQLQQQEPQPTYSLSLPLQNKVIAITGAASGIGFATAQECAARGANLALSDINLPALNDLVTNTLRPAFPQATITTNKCDVANSIEVDSWISSTITQFGRLDGACNVAGVETMPGAPSLVPLTETTDEHWQFVNNVNLTGVFYCLRAELRVMTNGGSIVSISSSAGLRGAPNLAAYAATKHGVIGLTKSAAKEVGPKGIRVNAVCPGPIETPMIQRLIRDGDQNQRDRFKALPLQRLGQASEVAKAVCHLLSDDASWTTGTTLAVCGGSTA